MRSHTIDHCRIGSLEMDFKFNDFIPADHCRIGSLEIYK